MFVKTVKVKKPNPMALAVILILSLLLIAIWVVNGTSGGIGEKYILKDNNERVQFLEDLGWDVSESEVQARVVKIPEEFNTVYEGYNKIQKEQGFDLSNYKGETVEVYTYDIYNYPERPNNVVAHLITFEGILIGGDVSCTEVDGFMQGLMPVKENENSSDVAETMSETKESENNGTEETKDAISFSTGAIVIEKP